MKYVCLFLMAATAQLMTATPAPERKGTIITFEHAEPGRAHLASSRTLVKSAPAPMSGCAVTIKITGGTPDDGVKLFAFSLDQDDITTADWDRSTKTAEFALTPGHSHCVGSGIGQDRVCAQRQQRLRRGQGRQDRSAITDLLEI